MSTFKKGEIVKIIANKNDHGFSIGEKVKILSIEEDGFIKCEYLHKKDYWYVKPNEIEKEVKTMDNLKVGDILTKTDASWTREVRGFVDDQIVTKISDEEGYTVDTLGELKEYGYKLKPEVKELTVEQISKELGYEVKVIK